MLIGIFYLQIVESSSLVSVLFREAISHPYISFFHSLVNVFSVTSNNNNYHNQHFRQISSEHTEAFATSPMPLATNIPEICVFMIGFSFTVWTRMRPLLLIN